jgi:hypothetical protein
MTGRTDRDDTKARQRATIDEARDEGIGEPEDGVELAVPSYADTGGVADLGVDEPVVPKDAQGDHVADQPDLPDGDGSPPPRRD